MNSRSPITQSENTRHISTYESSIMSDSQLISKRVDNYLCLDSGLIFNSSGPRGSEKGFYTDDYDLHSESEESEFKYFEENVAVGIYDDIVSFVCQGLGSKKINSILDIPNQREDTFFMV